MRLRLRLRLRLRPIVLVSFLLPSVHSAGGLIEVTLGHELCGTPTSLLTPGAPDAHRLHFDYVFDKAATQQQVFSHVRGSGAARRSALRLLLLLLLFASSS